MAVICGLVMQKAKFLMGVLWEISKTIPVMQYSRRKTFLSNEEIGNFNLNHNV